MNEIPSLILQINEMYDEIQIYESELERTNNLISSPSFTGMPKAGNDSSRTENTALRNIELEQAIIEKSVLLITYMEEAYNRIMKLPSVVSRIIALGTIFLGKGASEIGKELGFSGRHIERLYRESVYDDTQKVMHVPMTESCKFSDILESIKYEGHYVLESELQQDLYINLSSLLRHISPYSNPSASCMEAVKALDTVSSRFLLNIQYNMITKARRDIKRVKKRKNVITDAIDNMENRTYSQLLTLRYLEGMAWNDIAEEMSYDVNYLRHINKAALETLKRAIPKKYLKAA